VTCITKNEQSAPHTGRIHIQALGLRHKCQRSTGPLQRLFATTRLTDAFRISRHIFAIQRAS
jgi:hypothetical protein